MKIFNQFISWLIKRCALKFFTILFQTYVCTHRHQPELRQKVCLYIHTVVPIGGLPSLDGINELFVGKKLKKLLTKASQTDYNLPTVVFGLPEIFSYMC